MSVPGGARSTRSATAKRNQKRAVKLPFCACNCGRRVHEICVWLTLPKGIRAADGERQLRALAGEDDSKYDELRAKVAIKERGITIAGEHYKLEDLYVTRGTHRQHVRRRAGAMPSPVPLVHEGLHYTAIMVKEEMQRAEVERKREAKAFHEDEKLDLCVCTAGETCQHTMDATNSVPLPPDKDVAIKWLKALRHGAAANSAVLVFYDGLVRHGLLAHARVAARHFYPYEVVGWRVPVGDLSAVSDAVPKFSTAQLDIAWSAQSAAGPAANEAGSSEGVPSTPVPLSSPELPVANSAEMRALRQQTAAHLTKSKDEAALGIAQDVHGQVYKVQQALDMKQAQLTQAWLDLEAQRELYAGLQLKYEQLASTVDELEESRAMYAEIGDADAKAAQAAAAAAARREKDALHCGQRILKRIQTDKRACKKLTSLSSYDRFSELFKLIQANESCVEEQAKLPRAARGPADWGPVAEADERAAQASVARWRDVMLADSNQIYCETAADRAQPLAAMDTAPDGDDDGVPTAASDDLGDDDPEHGTIDAALAAEQDGLAETYYDSDGSVDSDAYMLGLADQGGVDSDEEACGEEETEPPDTAVAGQAASAAASTVTPQGTASLAVGGHAEYRRKLPYGGIDKSAGKRSLTPEMAFLLTLVKLRHVASSYTVGLLFGVSTQTASRVFRYWCTVLATYSRGLNATFGREQLKRCTTQDVIGKLGLSEGDVVVMGDATECQIMRSHSLNFDRKSYSSYKSKNTVKYLVFCAANGYPIKVSRGFCGSIQDQTFHREMRVAQWLNEQFGEPGEAPLVYVYDKGISEVLDFSDCHVTLIRPTAQRESNIHSGVHEGDIRIAQARIVVERVIGRMRNFASFCATRDPHAMHEDANMCECIRFLVSMQPPLSSGATHVARAEAKPLVLPKGTVALTSPY